MTPMKNARSAGCPVALLAIAALAALPLPGRAADVATSVELRDLRNAALIAGSVVCVTEAGQTQFQVKQAGVFEAGCAGVQPGKPVRFEVSGGASHGDRVVALQNRAVPKKILLKVYAARKLTGGYNHSYLSQGLEYLTRGEHDRALAHYEIAFFASSVVELSKQYDVKMKYNYARALASTCLRIGYATCDQAITQLDELKAGASLYPAVFAREGITVALLDATLRDIHAGQVIAHYAEFRGLFGSGEYMTAAATAEELLGKFETAPSAFSAARLTKDRIKEDIGTAYFRAAEAESVGQKASLLKRAMDVFESVESKNSTVVRNISATASRM